MFLLRVFAALMLAFPAVADELVLPDTMDILPTPRPRVGGISFRTPVPDPAFNDIVGGGLVIPTLYFLPVIDTDLESCEGEKLPLLLTSGDPAAEVCARSLSFCSEQGTCILKSEGVWHTYNVIRRVGGVDRFGRVKDSCRFGYGVRSICLDPFYSVAADLSIYSPGDVLYFPALRDVPLPNGQLHDGYVIVRDQGRGVRGHGRFDFFTGGMGWKDPRNPFVKLRLGAKGTGLPFYRISGGLAELVRLKRAFPVLPWPGEGLVEQDLGRENTAGTPTSALPEAMAARPAAPAAPAAADGGLPIADRGRPVPGSGLYPPLRGSAPTAADALRRPALPESMIRSTPTDAPVSAEVLDTL